MKYMLLVYQQEKQIDDTVREHCYEETMELIHDLKAKGQFLSASPLQPTSMATSVHVQDGKRMVTDGPFAETHEQLGGYFLIEAKNLDEAIDVAGRIPGARRGTIEVRPIIEVTGMLGV